jgi:threonine dehydratase
MYAPEVVLVDEEEVLPALAYGYRTLGLVLEPSAAVVIAAARTGRLPLDDDTVLVISGGNVDEELLDRALASAAT